MSGLILLLLLSGTADVRAQPAPSTIDDVNLLIDRGRHVEALARLDAIERSAAAQAQPVTLAQVELARGSVWQARGFARPALGHFQKALEIAQREAQRQLVSATYGALASAYGDLGQWARMLDFTERQYEADAEKGPDAEFRYQFQRGVAYLEFHDRDRAEAALKQALSYATSNGNARGVSMTYGELAAIALDWDRNPARALQQYDEALNIARRSRLRDLEATWLLASGAALLESGDLVRARARLEAAMRVERATGARRITPAALKNLALVSLREGNRQQAEAQLVAAQRAADQQDLAQLRWETRIERAVIAPAPEAAEQLFDQALDILEDAQSSVLVEQLRTGALRQAFASADPYDLAIDFLIGRGAVSKGFLVAERGRARAFLETLRMGADEIARALPPAYVEAEASLLADISEGQAALRLDTLTEGHRAALRTAIRADEEQLNTLRLRLASDAPAVAAIRYPQLWKVEDIQARVLGPSRAMIMFFLGARQSTSWIVDQGRVRVVRLPSQATIEAAVRDYLAAAGRPGSQKEPALASGLFQLLLPGFTVPPELDTLIIIPHGILHDLPFEVLRDADGRRLIERAAVEYAPSASSYADLAGRKQAPRPQSVMAIGNPVMSGRDADTSRLVRVDNLSLLKPLPFTGEELRNIARRYGRLARILEGEEATESALRTADVSNASILHFATHGFIDEEQPERSALVLTAGLPADDGVLQVREIYLLRLREALVTLSACQTALGDNVRGEGVIGLSRAFFYAGANAVVASLWSVSDSSTATFMSELYGGLAEGLPVSVALRRAKLIFIRSEGVHNDPYHWAAFVVSGNGGWHGVPVPPSRLSNLAALLLFGAAALGALLLVRRLVGR